MINYRDIFLGVLALLTVSCAGLPDKQQGCLSKGGDWRGVCLVQREQCVIPYSDGGKECSDSSECEGRCLADLTTKCTESAECIEPKILQPGEEVRGICQRDNDPCGSFIVIKNGRAEPVLHRD